MILAVIVSRAGTSKRSYGYRQRSQARGQGARLATIDDNFGPTILHGDNCTTTE